MKFKTPISQIPLLRACRITLSKLGNSGLIALLDTLFVASFYGIYILFKFLSGNLLAPVDTLSVLIYVASTMFYYIVLIFVYSFFKYTSISYVKNFFSSSMSSFGRLLQFFYLNMVVAGVFFSAVLAFNFLLARLKQEFQPYFLILAAGPFILFLYYNVNSAQFAFFRGNSIKKSLKIASEKLFSNAVAIFAAGFFLSLLILPNLLYQASSSQASLFSFIVTIAIALIMLVAYFKKSIWEKFGMIKMREVVVFPIALLSLLLIAISIIGYVIVLVWFGNYSMYLFYYGIYTQATLAFFDFFVYAIIFLNRIIFYELSS